MLVYHKGDAEVDQLIDGKRNRKMTGKGRQYRLAVLEKRQVKLVARTIRKSEQHHCERRAGTTERNI